MKLSYLLELWSLSGVHGGIIFKSLIILGESFNRMEERCVAIATWGCVTGNSCNGPSAFDNLSRFLTWKVLSFPLTWKKKDLRHWIG